MSEGATQTSDLILVAALTGLVLGAATLWLGVQEGAIAFWSFGVASLLHVPPSWSLWQRVRDGLGNSGLERDRLTLRFVSHLLRWLALGTAMAAISALLGNRAARASLPMVTLLALASGLQALLWRAKRGFSRIHPALHLDAVRTRTLLELAALALVGSLAGQWFPSADAITGLFLALRLFVEGRTLAKGTTLQAAACGGCGSGCG